MPRIGWQRCGDTEPYRASITIGGILSINAIGTSAFASATWRQPALLAGWPRIESSRTPFRGSSWKRILEMGELELHTRIIQRDHAA